MQRDANRLKLREKLRAMKYARTGRTYAQMDGQDDALVHAMKSATKCLRTSGAGDSAKLQNAIRVLSGLLVQLTDDQRQTMWTTVGTKIGLKGGVVARLRNLVDQCMANDVGMPTSTASVVAPTQ